LRANTGVEQSEAPLAAGCRSCASSRDYHEHPGYIDALRASVTEHWQAHGRTAHLLISFHGIPERYVHQGDPYFCRCQTTARLLADETAVARRE